MGTSDRRKFIDSFLKMNMTTWMSLALAVFTLARPALSAEPRVVCYYTNWSVYRPGTARFNPQNINPYLCTHLVYAFGGFTKDNTLKPFDKYQDIEKGGYAKFTGLKTYNKNLKTMLAIGGWNEGSTRFSPMVASRERRKEFVRNAIKFLRQNRFDGLDLDWEYPAFRDGGKPKDRENYAKLVKELREEFDRESEKTGRPRLLLTMAVPAGIEYIQKGFDVKTLNQYLDWMNLLTYDYHSAFEPAVNHHAPLYPLEEPNEYSVDSELNIDYTIKFYLENGADPDKLVLGIPTYGRSYTLFNADAVEIGSPADGPGEQGDATREKGYLAYYEICESLKPKEKKRSTPDEDSDEESEEEEEDLPWNVVYPNPKAMGPVAYRGNQWVGYDDVDIVRKKAEYVAENGLGGIMFWSIDNDDFRGNCHGKPYPLIEAAKEAYIVALGSTDNAIVTDRPRSSTTSRSSGRRKNRPRSSSTTTTTAKPSTASKTNKRKSGSSSITSTTPTWNIITPEPPTTPDPGADFKCTEEGFFQHPRDCKKYFWCLDSGPSNLGIVAHQFTCPSGLFFNKAADSCDFARNVLCKTKPGSTTSSPTTKAVTTSTSTTTTRRPVKLSTRSSLQFRTSTTTTTPEPEEEEYDEDLPEDSADIDAEDPKVIKELIDLIRRAGGVEQLEKSLHLNDGPVSTDGAITTTPSTFNKQLVKKVLERTRGRLSNSLSDNSSQNSRRGPQNAGLEATSDKDKLLKKDRPQYTTIQRSRPSTSSSNQNVLNNESLEEDIEVPQLQRARAVESEAKVATTAKPLQYVNIRRARPTSDTADDTASRNALFERPESFVAVSESSSLDIAGSRRENMPEYVTIRRQRPTTEEATTTQYHTTETEIETRETTLEKEISSPSSQPQYTSIVRSRSTTLPPADTSSPEPTTVLAVQISSLLNSASSSEVGSPETTIAEATEIDATTTSTTSTTTTTTPTPTTASTRRTILRRRGSTTSTSSTTPASTTQVSSRNYNIVRRRRPLSQPNEIISDSDETTELSRKIRSTTPDSIEVDDRSRETGPFRQVRTRFQTQADDSVPAAAAQLSRGQFRPKLSRDEVLSLTPIDVETPQFVEKPSFRPRAGRQFRGRTTVADALAEGEETATVEVPNNLETPQFVPRPSFGPRPERLFRVRTTTTEAVAEIDENATVETPNNAETPQFGQRPSFSPRTDRRFRGRTTAALALEDSEVSAATVEIRRPNILPRGRGRFTPSSTTAATEQTSPATESPQSSRRPSFARYSPRPFTRLTTEEEKAFDDATTVVTQRLPSRLPFGRTRPSTQSASSTTTQPIQARRVPFLYRQSTPQILTNDNEQEESEEKNDDIHLSETSIAEKEHENEDIDQESVSEAPKRRIIIKKLRTPTGATDSTVSTESVPITDDNGRKKIRVIRRRPSSTTEATDVSSTSFEGLSSAPHRVRKVIRKKIKPIEDEPEIIAKSIGSLNAAKDTTTEIVANYGEKSRPSILQSTESSDITEHKPEEVIISKDVELKAESEEVKDKIEDKKEEQEQTSEDVTKLKITENNDVKSSEKPTESINDAALKPEVALETNEKAIDLSDSKDELMPVDPVDDESNKPQQETSTTSTTQLTSPTSRSRVPYRPTKRIFTSTTEATPSSSRSFSRKFNPGAYTSPATVDKVSETAIRVSTRRPLFSSKTFTRRPFTTRTTKKVEEEEYSDEEILDEEPENPIVLVPPSQLFTRRPRPDEDREEDEEDFEEIFDEEDEEEPPTNRFTPTSKKPIFKPRVINSNTFRTSTSTTELPKRPSSPFNRTVIFSRFGGNRPVNDTKKRVQNVPIGYKGLADDQAPKIENELKDTDSENDPGEVGTTTSINEMELTTGDDDYLSITETSTVQGSTNAGNAITSTNEIESETATAEIEIDNSTDEYLEFTEGTTNYPSTQDSTTSTQAEIENETSSGETTVTNTGTSAEISTAKVVSETTTSSTTTTSQTAPIVKTQYDKLFSVSRRVEVSSKLDKHRLNKKNETTLIEEGKIMVEKEPQVDKIGEVSRFSLIKIFEDEIPIYLTKLGHVYPVENPPDNLIRIDEARNARALSNFADAPRENLIASESMNEAYRHVNQVTNLPKPDFQDKGHIEHVQSDDFLSYINEDKKDGKLEERFYPQWQFVPAAYENEKNKAAKQFEIITPRSMLTEPSTLPLEALFKTENPVMARKVNDNRESQPFVVYSASIPTQKEDANIVKIGVLKPETGRSIITFAKGQEFHGASVTEQATVRYPINISVAPKTSESSTVSTTTTTLTTESIKTSPVIELLTTTSTTTKPEAQTTILSTTEASTTEITTEEATTAKGSLFDTKRKFAFPRRPIIKPANITRPAPRTTTAKKVNATLTSNSLQKANKTTSFNANKARFGANRGQNVPVDIRKKSTTKASKSFTTETPRTTTERKLYFKPIRPGVRPAFVPRRNTTPPPTQASEET